MIVDTSVVVSIVKGEDDGERLALALHQAEKSYMSAASYFETGIVVDAWKNPKLSIRVDEVLDRFSIQIEPVTLEQARIARQAYRDYGKGSGHAANLNFGDCFSYALARVYREPILYKGDDFGHTDLRSAV